MSYRNELPAIGSKKRVLEVYGSNSTTEYQALRLAVGEAVVANSPDVIEKLSRP